MAKYNNTPDLKAGSGDFAMKAKQFINARIQFLKNGEKTLSSEVYHECRTVLGKSFTLDKGFDKETFKLLCARRSARAKWIKEHPEAKDVNVWADIIGMAGTMLRLQENRKSGNVAAKAAA